MRAKKDLGQKGELKAVEYLKNHGYQIISRNETTPYGEIDIIAIENNELVIVEVKTRTSTFFGRPLEAVNHKKLTHLTNAAEFYQQKHPNLPEAIRIDVVEVFAGDEFKINLITRIDQ